MKGTRSKLPIRGEWLQTNVTVTDHMNVDNEEEFQFQENPHRDGDTDHD